MAIRFMLVGLVASLGFDLPGGDEMAGWVASGRAWVQARMVDAWGPSDESAAEAGDVAFAQVVDRMADDFAADLAAAERPASDVLLVFDPIEVPETAEPGLADALNRGGQGVGVRVETAPPTASPEAPARSARLIAALRLTTQAATAWLTLLESPGGTTAR